MGVGISDKSNTAVSNMTNRDLYVFDDSTKSTAGQIICAAALIPWPIMRKNPRLSKAFFAAMFSMIACLLMRQTVMTRKSTVMKMGKLERSISTTMVLRMFDEAALQSRELVSIVRTKEGTDWRITSTHTATAVKMKYFVLFGASTGLCQHVTTTKTVIV